MEIIFNNDGTATITRVTMAELQAFVAYTGKEMVLLSATETETPSPVVPKAKADLSCFDFSRVDEGITGMTIPEMAKRLGKCHQTVEYRIGKYNIQPIRITEKGWRLYNWEEVKANFDANPVTRGGYHGKKKAKPKVVKSPFAKWSSDQRAKVKDKGLDVGKTFSLVFREMTHTYGVVWDQVKKDFYKANGRSSNSTIELCYFLQYEQEHKPEEHFEHLFENQLEKILA